MEIRRRSLNVWNLIKVRYQNTDNVILLSSQPAFTCSRLTIETLEQSVNYVQSKLTIKTPERRHWRRVGVFIVNVEHISHLTIVNFENVIVGWTQPFQANVPLLKLLEN